jgi:hypothetical protein
MMPDAEPSFVRLFTPIALLVTTLFVLEAIAVSWLRLRVRSRGAGAGAKQLRLSCVLGGLVILTALGIYMSVVIAYYQHVAMPQLRQHEATRPYDPEPRKVLREKVRNMGLSAASAYLGFIVSAFSWARVRKAEKESGTSDRGAERFDATHRIEPL